MIIEFALSVHCDMCDMFLYESMGCCGTSAGIAILTTWYMSCACLGPRHPPFPTRTIYVAHLT